MVKELQGVTAPPVHWAHITICRYVEGLMAAFDAVSQSGSHRIHIGHSGTSLSQTRTVVETAVAIVFPLYSCWAHWCLPILDTNRCAHSAIPIGHTDTSLLSTQTVQDYIWRISQGGIRVWRDISLYSQTPPCKSQTVQYDRTTSVTYLTGRDSCAA